MDDASTRFSQRTGATELRRLARRESGRVCQRVPMIANMLEGMNRFAGDHDLIRPLCAVGLGSRFVRSIVGARYRTVGAAMTDIRASPS
jgi:hypothetical protein